MKKKRIILAVVFFMALLIALGAVWFSTARGPEAFRYEHDPRQNAAAMADIIVNPDAVYGFSPNPESTRLGTYAEYDWTDPEFVASAKKSREEYHAGLESMYTMLYEMTGRNEDTETIARALSAERNRLRLASYENDPEGLAKAKQSNLDTYGNENGPTADSLYEKYGSWGTVIQKAFSSNAGMDACCGLYDVYFDTYTILEKFN